VADQIFIAAKRRDGSPLSHIDTGLTPPREAHDDFAESIIV